MKIKTTKIKAFISIEILLFFFSISILLKIYKEYTEKIINYKIINLNKKRLGILKKYLCIYIKKSKSLPPFNKLNEINFDEDSFLKKIPEFYKTDLYKKPFKIYKANMDANEIIYLTMNIHNVTYKIVIYGHDINIYNCQELKSFFNNKSIVLINNEHKCSN